MYCFGVDLVAFPLKRGVAVYVMYRTGIDLWRTSSRFVYGRLRDQLLLRSRVLHLSFVP